MSMRPSVEDVENLLHLQQVDLEALQLRKKFDELPQRAEIVALRKKREAVQAKLAKVEALSKDAAAKLARIVDEDAALATKAEAVQADLDAVRGDYRSVESRTKELAGIAKRRATLEKDREAAAGELHKVEDVEAQIALMMEEIDAAEERAVASFRSQGGALRTQLSALQAQRDELAAATGEAALSLYEKTAKHAGSVAIGVLTEGRCGVCRTPLEGGRLIELKASAPLGTCPHCKRLLAIA